MPSVLRFLYPVSVISTTEQMLGIKLLLLLTPPLPLLTVFFFFFGVTGKVEVVFGLGLGLGLDGPLVDATSLCSNSSLLKYSISWETREAMVPLVPIST